MWNPGEDYELLKSWLGERGLSMPVAQALPPHGYIVCDPEPLAACFLFKYEGLPVGVVDLLVTRPRTAGRKTRDAVGHLFAFLSELAPEIGITELAGHVWNEQMKAAAARIGFTAIREGGIMVWKSV